MTRRLLPWLAAVTALATVVPSAAASPDRSGDWVGTWEGVPETAVALACTDCTIRSVIHTSAGGDEVRVRISNVFGTKPLLLGHATVALPAGTMIAPGSLRDLNFDGQRTVTIPPGASVQSDPAHLDVPALHDLLVTTYTPGRPDALTYHVLAEQTSAYAAGADRAADPNGADFPQHTDSWYLVTGVAVRGTPARGAVVALGDSITDGFAATDGADHRWPDILAARVATGPPGRAVGVLNAGIAGNRLLLDGAGFLGPAALGRFDRDVLAQPGVRTVIVLLGINDIDLPPRQLDPDAIITGLRTLADRGHEAGLRVVGATLTPYENSAAYDQAGERTRETVNDWIRHTSGYDAVIDFDAALRDPTDPLRLLPAYDSGDHLHPDDAGYAAMADAVDPSQL